MVVIEQALEMLEGCGPEFGEVGLSNHGPMAAEALIALGRGDAVEPWVAGYRTRLVERPPAVARIEHAAWQEALGAPERVSDWEAYFARELALAPWREVLETWVRRLAPGVMAGATHGLIRTAHAVRSLSGDESSRERLAELASGLAYWAARYQALPGTPRPVEPRRPSEALAAVPILPLELRDPSRSSIFAAVKDLDSYAPFERVVDLAAPGDDVSAFISDLTATMAKLYLANAGRPSIAYVHTVTAPSALRMLAPFISWETARLAARYAWLAAAAVHSRHAQPHEFELPAEPPSATDLIDQAIATGDEHAIKFTEAALREYALNPDPALLAGPLDLSGRFLRRASRA